LVDCRPPLKPRSTSDRADSPSRPGVDRAAQVLPCSQIEAARAGTLPRAAASTLWSLRHSPCGNLPETVRHRPDADPASAPRSPDHVCGACLAQSNRRRTGSDVALPMEGRPAEIPAGRRGFYEYCVRLFEAHYWLSVGGFGVGVRGGYVVSESVGSMNWRFPMGWLSMTT